MEKERDWFRREALDLDKMNKDHKRVLLELRQRRETVSEDRDFMHQQLIEAKGINRNAMYELDQYKQAKGDLDCFAGAPFKAIGSSGPASD